MAASSGIPSGFRPERQHSGPLLIRLDFPRFRPFRPQPPRLGPPHADGRGIEGAAHQRLSLDKSSWRARSRRLRRCRAAASPGALVPEGVPRKRKGEPKQVEEPSRLLAGSLKTDLSSVGLVAPRRFAGRRGVPGSSSCESSAAESKTGSEASSPAVPGAGAPTLRRRRRGAAVAAAGGNARRAVTVEKSALGFAFRIPGGNAAPRSRPGGRPRGRRR